MERHLQLSINDITDNLSISLNAFYVFCAIKNLLTHLHVVYTCVCGCIFSANLILPEILRKA